MQNILKKKKYLIIMMALFAGLSFMQCTQLGLIAEDDDNEEQAFLAALLLQNSCSLGGVSFISSGATCGSGSASGSGVLTAVGTRTTFLSVQLDFTLNDTSSTIQVVGGGTSDIVADSTTSNYFRIANSATTIHPNGTTSLTGAGTTAKSFCMEMHFEENPDHLIFDANACTTKTTASATGEDETNTLSTSGGNWGIVLSNATITGMTFNNSEMFSD